jgi:hypothetical protein
VNRAVAVGTKFTCYQQLPFLNREGIHFCISVYLEDMAFYSIDEGLSTELISSPELEHLCTHSQKSIHAQSQWPEPIRDRNQRLSINFVPGGFSAIVHFLYDSSAGRSPGNLARQKHFTESRREKRGCRPKVVAFRESGRLPSLISYRKREFFSALIQRRHWKYVQLHSLSDAPTGRLSILTNEQLV